MTRRIAPRRRTAAPDGEEITWVRGPGGVWTATTPTAVARRRKRLIADQLAALIAERYATPEWFANAGMCEPARDPAGFERLREAVKEAEQMRGWEQGHKWGAA